MISFPYPMFQGEPKNPLSKRAQRMAKKAEAALKVSKSGPAGDSYTPVKKRRDSNSSTKTQIYCPLPTTELKDLVQPSQVQKLPAIYQFETGISNPAKKKIFFDQETFGIGANYPEPNWGENYGATPSPKTINAMLYSVKPTSPPPEYSEEECIQALRLSIDQQVADAINVKNKHLSEEEFFKKYKNFIDHQTKTDVQSQNAIWYSKGYINKNELVLLNEMPSYLELYRGLQGVVEGALSGVVE